MAATTRARKSSKSSTGESRWSALVREAKKDLPVREPYVLDAVEPPIEIAAPDGLERSLALARLSDTPFEEMLDNLVPILEALVGPEVFERVWTVIRDEPVEVTLALIDDLTAHFNAGADTGAEEFPGGEQAS